MGQRGWTPEQLDEAVKSGWRIDAIDKATNEPATRYVNPTTGRSVVINNVTNDIVQVAGDGFRFSVASGDKPGAAMRPPPDVGSSSEPSGSGGEGGGGGASDPFPPRSRFIPDEELPSE
jgi:hypothetical protein